jgi:hypothetical protein
MLGKIMKTVGFDITEEEFNEITNIAKSLHITKNKLLRTYVLDGLNNGILQDAYIDIRESELVKERDNLKALSSK